MGGKHGKGKDGKGKRHPLVGNLKPSEGDKPTHFRHIELKAVINKCNDQVRAPPASPSSLHGHFYIQTEALPAPSLPRRSPTSTPRSCLRSPWAR